MLMVLMVPTSMIITGREVHVLEKLKGGNSDDGIPFEANHVHEVQPLQMWYLDSFSLMRPPTYAHY
jgi:hypothetical protein